TTIGKLEQAIVRIMNDQYESEDGREAEFTTHAAGNDTYRFLNLPDELNLDLAVKQIDDVLVLTSSDEAMQTILSAQQLPPETRLANHPPYRITLENVERSDMTRIVYIDTQNFLRFASDINALDYATLRDDYKVPDEFVGVSWSERVGSTTRGFLNIF
ncbi:MAG: hypothetical protein KC653_01325, partial [Candidatus Andersenbacteria bacterium]|nr:hypothetical protein [Candidatus Andersenbacteria bacterium]